ncbi:MAG: YkgJ family cysteine cluster protein [Bacteroidetes bacterium]|nr:MAG: YkgJ family cysteine cluster protein [Bacteroidota bacterium]
MTKSDNIQFVKYKILLNEIQKQTAILEEMHREYIKCRSGCSLCCIDFSVFPVEFYFILNELKKKNFKPETDLNNENEICVFLKNNSCTIYEQRPIMCRTHGLPLLYANDDGEWELSACELNFTEFDFDDFTDDNTLPQDKYNSKLYLLNREFIAEFTEKKYGETDLIPLKEIGKQLFETKK